MTKIIGISSFYHDSAVAYIKNGEIIYAAQEERFSRVKHDSSFPVNALKNLLKFNALNLNEIDYIVYYEKPFLKFERLIETYLAFSPKGFKQFMISMPLWLNEKLFLKNNIIKELKKIDPNFNNKKLFFSEHHLSHASSAFYPSPFNDALIFTADGVGEWVTTSVGIGKNNTIKMIKEINFPNSIGLLYSAFTYYIGFKVNSGEYKLMGLAPYGKPIFYKKIMQNLIDIKKDGSFRLNQKYFDYSTGFKMVNSNFNKLFGKAPRIPESKIEKFHMNIAASIQKVVEEIIINILTKLRSEYSLENLCMAGGVALNCVVNGKILEKNIFKKIWVQPAAGDSGAAIGAALGFWHTHLRKKRKPNFPDGMKGSYLGPNYKLNEIENCLKKLGAVFKKYDEANLIEKVARDIYLGKAIGWFQNKMEFGPRSLGNRSIIADPRNPNIRELLNLKIKFRESFRPFAPSILYSEVSKWFSQNIASPYMLFVSQVKDIHLRVNKKKSISNLEQINKVRSKIPAVTHIDNSARIQTVHKETNPKYFKLIKKFQEISGVPMVVNTSFNIRGEPIVCSPEDAFRCFMSNDLDVLVLENFYLDKKSQNFNLKNSYISLYKLD